jgi:16S rRNA (uracil1498-N3)-methyltransferase
MRIPRIHTHRPLAPDTEIELEPGPSQHLARALRMHPGSALVLFDGRGGEYPATLLAVSKNSVTARTGSHLPREAESALAIHLGLAVSRGERMDWAVQKATELGVSELTPLFSERTEVRLSGERAEKKRGHWRQIAISACEQCGRNRVPGIHPLQGLDDWLLAARGDLKLVLHHRCNESPAIDPRPRSLSLLVGPEGGLSGEEIGRAEAAGFQSLALGPRVLRTETAPLAAIAILQARWGDMGLTL